MTNEAIKIVSLNAQGLSASNHQKRRDVLHFLRKKKYSILCIQDTHFNKEIEHIVKAEWGGQVFFSSYSRNSRGVAIFMENNFEFEVHKEIKDHSGNFLILDITIEGHRITLANIYAPNKDEPLFFINIKNEILKLGNAQILIMGDWNLMLDPTLDGKNYKNINNKKAREEVHKIIAELNMYEIWREENRDTRKYTWRRKIYNNQIQMGRLDFILASENILTYCKQEKILPGYRSDHSMITVNLEFSEPIERRTFWKFNNSLLHDVAYVQKVKEEITKTKEEYTTNTSEQNEGETMNEPNMGYQLFLEVLLMKIRGMTIQYAARKKKKNLEEMESLEKEIK